MSFSKILTLLLVNFLTTGLCSPFTGDLQPGTDLNTQNQLQTYPLQYQTDQSPDPDYSQAVQYPNPNYSGDGQYPTNPAYYPESQGPAITQQCSTHQQLCNVQACCDQLECKIDPSTGYPLCFTFGLSQAQLPADPILQTDGQQQPNVEDDKCGYYNLVPTSPSTTYPNGPYDQRVYRILSVSNRHFRDDIDKDGNRETTVVDIVPFPEAPTGAGELLPSPVGGEGPPSSVGGEGLPNPVVGEGPTRPVGGEGPPRPVGGEGPPMPVVVESPPSPIVGGEEQSTVSPVETGEPPLSLGGSGGGGGGDGYSPGGSGGSVQGVGIAVSGTPGIGIYICNSDSLEINISIGGTGALPYPGDGTGTISYSTRIKGPPSGDKGFQLNQPQDWVTYPTTYSYKALLQENGELGLVPAA